MTSSMASQQPIPAPAVPATISVTSGKGGVGKSQFVVSASVLLRQEGRKVLLVDADVGCGNLDVLLGLQPEHDLRSVLQGDKDPEEIIVTAQVGDVSMDMLAAPAPNREGSDLEPAEQLAMIDAVARAGLSYDALIVDTGAGVSRNPMLFASAADRVILITTPDPTALKDAYHAIKTLYERYRTDRIDLVVNMVQGARDGKRVYGQLTSVVDRFLPVEVRLLGVLPYDDRVVRAVRACEPTSHAYPSAAYSHAVRKIVRRLLDETEKVRSGGQVRYFGPARKPEVVDGEDGGDLS
ncbi:MAG: P-loop NTPase [Myxococcota bacterium]|nr:P-loop NTPase [Myxococcota bacterium]